MMSRLINKTKSFFLLFLINVSKPTCVFSLGKQMFLFLKKNKQSFILKTKTYFKKLKLKAEVEIMTNLFGVFFLKIFSIKFLLCRIPE